MRKDPVCGMQIDEQKAAGKIAYQGATYYFCSQGCQQKFESHPDQYTTAKQAGSGAPQGHH